MSKEKTDYSYILYITLSIIIIIIACFLIAIFSFSDDSSNLLKEMNDDALQIKPSSDN